MIAVPHFSNFQQSSESTQQQLETENLLLETAVVLGCYVLRVGYHDRHVVQLMRWFIYFLTFPSPIDRVKGLSS